MGSTIAIVSSVKANTDSARICGAMAEQRPADGNHDNESMPQQFVHLIGCRDPNARKTPRPRASLPKA
jgi:hypothetical protein